MGIHMTMTVRATAIAPVDEIQAAPLRLIQALHRGEPHELCVRSGRADQFVFKYHLSESSRFLLIVIDMTDVVRWHGMKRSFNPDQMNVGTRGKECPGLRKGT
jgi:hypothetical protein